MYAKIIIPIDLAHEARLDAMLAVAARLAAPDATVTVVHVVENLPAYVAAELTPDVSTRFRTEAEASLRRLLAGRPEKLELEVREGGPAAEILDAARERDADLIVIASHRPQFGDFLIGSTAARVVRHAPCSVHVIR